MPAPPSDSGSGSSCVLERCAVVVAGAFSRAGANHLAPANSAPIESMANTITAAARE
jgi:hypothetical protein